MPRCRAAYRLVCAASVVLALTAPADASLVRALDLRELTAAADHIVVGDVVAVDAAWDGGHRAIYTTVEVAVSESWKGDAGPAGRVRVRQLGGTVGDIEMTVVGTAKFQRGERALLFLRRAQVVGMAQGKRRVRWEPGTRQWLVDAADGTDVVGLDASGRTHPAKPEPVEALDRLRARVAALVQR